ncbi:hypothetical protein BC829DRAFT_449536 [Chytridium lagenaria]|nr:hypothetical protein BC829DRAFT_449536 [Chytridium lagenaria]
MALTILGIVAGVVAATAGAIAGLYNVFVPSKTGMMNDLSSVDDKNKESYPEDFWQPSFKANLTHGKTHYSMQGPQDGPRIVLVHGLLACWAAMPEFIAGLVGHGYLVLLYDTYGRGYSAAPGVAYDHLLYVQQLKELLDEVGWTGGVNVVGYSLGGAIATVFSATYPEMVKNVVLIAPTGLKLRLPPLGVLVSVPIFGDVIVHTVGRKIMASQLGKEFRLETRDTDRVKHTIAVTKTIALHHPGYMRALVSTIRVGPIRKMEQFYEKNGTLFGDRILCIWGTEDTICDFNKEFPRFKAVNPNACIIELEGFGHEVVPDSPQIVFNLIHEYLKDDGGDETGAAEYDQGEGNDSTSSHNSHEYLDCNYHQKGVVVEDYVSDSDDAQRPPSESIKSFHSIPPIKEEDTAADTPQTRPSIRPSPTMQRGVMRAGSIWSFITLSYLNKMMKKSVKRPLEIEDIPVLSHENRSGALAQCLDGFNEEMDNYLKRASQHPPPPSGFNVKNNTPRATSPKLQEKPPTSIWPTAVVIIATMALLVPISVLLSKFTKSYMFADDERIQSIREVLLSIKTLKLEAGEGKAKERIKEARNIQVKMLVKFAVAFTGLAVLAILPAIIMPVAAFLVYSESNGGEVDAAIVFPALFYFDNIFMPLQRLPSTRPPQVEPSSPPHLLPFFSTNLLPTRVTKTSPNPDDEDFDVIIEDATLKWEGVFEEEHHKPRMNEREKYRRDAARAKREKGKKESVPADVNDDAKSKNEPIFRNLNLRIKKGAITAVVGVVGSGKSSLISAMLGEMTLLSGRIQVRSHISLCQQQPWLQSTSILQNILLGRPLNDDRLDASLRACGSAVTLIQWITGSTLRLAKKECVMGLMKGRTRLLVTHQLQVLRSVDWVVVMDAGRPPHAYHPTHHSYHRLHNPSTDNDDENNLIAPENRRRGNLGLDIILSYTRMAGGPPFLVALGVLSALAMGTSVARELCLAWWSEQKLGLSLETYQAGYATLGVGFWSGYSVGGVRASNRLHDGAVDGLLYAKMSFFDSQPVGRMLNRMSRDVEELDYFFWITLINGFVTFIMVISSVASLVVTNPYVILVSAVREIKRIVVMERSPLNAHVSECMHGVVCIRAFKAEDRMTEKLWRLMDRVNAVTAARDAMGGWLSVRIELFTVFIVLFVSIFGVLSPNFSPSLLGLSMQIGDSLARMIASFLTYLIQIEAILHPRPREPPHDLPTDPPPSDWPKTGEIVFSDLSVKYDNMLEPVIRDVSLSLRSGERVGIVGRTGSGKSTLLSALFRLVEPHTGSITVDGIDLSQMGLATIRRRLQIIPQDPVLLSGTIRSNIDPENTFSDATLWESLDAVGLKAYITSLPKRLDHQVEERGLNLSAGQRQLLILARSLCRNPRILVLDEASSSVRRFCLSPIDLNTVAGFDRVVVMDAGRVVEVGTPLELLEISGGYFAALVEATGVENMEMIRKAAEERGKMKVVDE